MKKIIVDEKSLSKTLDRLALEIVERHADTGKLCLVGIKTRGVYIAQRLQERIKNFYKIDLPLGVLDITLYRDDLTQVAQDPQMKGASIGFDIKSFSPSALYCDIKASFCERMLKISASVSVDRSGHST